MTEIPGAVKQPPITIRYGAHPLDGCNVDIPTPPDGCETEQALHFAGVAFAFSGPNAKLQRIVLGAYAKRYNIPVNVQRGDGTVATESPHVHFGASS